MLSVKPVLAVSIGVKPTELNLNVKSGKEVEGDILIINTGGEPALYHVYPDGLNKKIIVKPSDFRLEAYSNQIVAIIAKSQYPGRFSTNLSITARPLGSSGVVVASGIKVPITVTSADIPFWWVILEAVIGGCLIIFFMVKLKNKRRQRRC
ncbi:MAG: hypothetical protein Q8O41_00410 [Candidatus Methanoperedens sp.]|nr:hypothetical protein [Candidatus Methanoperedens sp.]